MDQNKMNLQYAVIQQYQKFGFTELDVIASCVSTICFIVNKSKSKNPEDKREWIDSIAEKLKKIYADVTDFPEDAFKD